MNKNQGFTLIEMSIVLVIVGLIAGGVMVGASLSDSARLRTAYKQVEDYKTALYGFKMKYAKLPGDMNNALSFFPTCPNPPSAMCNGNGDGYIDHANGPKPAERKERYKAFHHLVFAGLLDEPIYSGPGGAGYVYNGSDCPQSKLNSASCFEFRGGYIHLGAGAFLSDSAFSVEDGFKIDSKFDDGIGDKGMIIVGGGADTWPSCRSSPGFGAHSNWWMGTGSKIACLMDVYW